IGGRAAVGDHPVRELIGGALRDDLTACPLGDDLAAGGGGPRHGRGRCGGGGGGGCCRGGRGGGGGCGGGGGGEGGGERTRREREWSSGGGSSDLDRRPRGSWRPPCARTDRRRAARRSDRVSARG